MNALTLQRAMPGLDHGKAVRYTPLLNRAMTEFGITTTKRAAAFLAQLGHESVSLRYFEEIASGEAYEGRRDLGNTQPGDGRRYKGRGPIQLTGRANYRTYGRLLGLPLERMPRLAAQPAHGFRIAALFWQRMDGNTLADRGDFREITRRINGGYNGWGDRVRRWKAIKRLGDAVLPMTHDEILVAGWRSRLARVRLESGRRRAAGQKPWPAGLHALADELKRNIRNRTKGKR